MRSQHTQLIGADGIGTACLDSVFTHSAEVKFILEHCTQPVELLCGERRRCAAAHVDGHDAQPQNVDLCGGCGDLLFERFEKRRDELHALLNRLAHEAAISAAGGAEGDAHIKANILRREGSGGAKSLARSRHAQLRAGRADVIFPDEAAQGFIFVMLLGYQCAEHLAGAHTGERAPRWARAAGAERRAVYRVLYEPLTHPVGMQLVRHRIVCALGAARVCTAVQTQGAAGGSPLRGMAETYFQTIALGLAARIFGALRREHRQQHLLDGVFIFMPVKIEPHCLPPLLRWARRSLIFAICRP